ncbi:MAG TPA: chemotaxis protein CheA [Methylomirabilota bacterium]|nr:chemotaxis protein CheA [Methylomirabilota bacterium]
MPLNDDLQQQLIKDLLIESAEGLDRFDRELLALEKGEGTPDTPNVIFRVIHTIKGTAGCLGLTKIESVAHVGENLLSALREGRVQVTPPLITALLSYADALRQMLRCLETTGNEGTADYTTLLDELQALQNAPSAAPTAGSVPSKQTWGLFDDESASAPAAPPAKPTSPSASATPQEHPAERESAARNPSAAESAIRVGIDQLDKLMNLVGELVLARNQIVQFTNQAKDATFVNASQRLNLITTELQESVMKTRMQPIGNVWAKFPRVARDVAHELGKKVQLVMEGNETELDRTIIEAIKDPLTHIVRNAIDHGVETPDARRAAGKPEEGLLILRAFHEGGQVNIEIMDDGRGIDVARVKQKAVEKGLLGPDQANRLSDREAFNLVFLPGFSTAEKVTNVSGRGVGMDVVKTNIEKIGGSVDVLSEAGKGTTIKIKIPLTLAIIPALIVTSSAERFAIPQVSLVELVRLESEQARKGIEKLYGAPVYRLRGQLLPLCYLHQELALDASTGKPPTPGPGAPDLPGGNHVTEAALRRDEAVNIVVLQADGRQFGLIVDEINDTEEIVVKPLSKQLKGLNCFAGATIMGDGKVALILDVLGLAQHAKVISEVRDRALADQAKTETRGGERQTLLLFDAGQGSRMAIPLSMVARLEEFPRSAVERSGAQEVVQYRGQILPLIPVGRFIPGAAAAAASSQDPMQVVVYSEQGRSVGLVVGRINDIVEEAITIKRDAAAHGILGSAVIQDKVTDLLDVGAVIRQADPAFYQTP